MEWTTEMPPNPFTLLFVLLVILLIMRAAEVGYKQSCERDGRSVVVQLPQ
jgi:hypothetical protein